MTPLRAKSILPVLLCASLLAVAAPRAQGLDIVVHASTVEKALKARLFTDHGRYHLVRAVRCNDPYLENPVVSFRQGRVYVGAHFGGQIGALVSGSCRSITQPGAIVLSARPVARGHEAALEDVRVESADTPMVAVALQGLIGADLLAPMRIDLLEAMRALAATDKTIPYAVVLRTLELSNLAVQDGALHVTLGGAVEIR